MTKILGLLGMYFDVAVVEVKKNLILFRFFHLPYCEKLVQKNKKKSPPIPFQIWLIESILGKYILGLIVELKFNAQPGSQILNGLFTTYMLQMTFTCNT